MKKNTLLIITASLCFLLLSSCGVEDLTQPAGSGDRVVFKTGITYENGIATRTVYSGDGDYVGETLVRERINWVSGDEIRIWSDKAHLPDGSANWADYVVTPTSNANANSYASVANKGANGLVWGEGTHEFYSLYPSPASASGASSINGKTVSVSIPSLQSYTVQDGKLMPDMDYAYMYAALRTEVSSSVTLSFKPMFTAFEFTVDSADDPTMTLTSFELISSSSELSGSFNATLTANADSPSSTASYSLGETTKSVRLDFTGGLTIRKGEPKSFTVFTLPIDVTDLKIRFTNNRGEVKSLSLNLADGTPVAFTGCKKYRITSLGVPGTWTYSIDQIPNITLRTDNEKVYGGNRDITVVSQRKRGTTAEPFPWRAQARVNGVWVEAGDPNWPDWLSLSAYSGDGDNNTVTVHIGPNEIQKAPLGGLGASIAETMSSKPEVGSESAPYDLSVHNIYGNTNTGSRSTTANSYVVGNPGWYMFPLVYGNAIKNGSNNTQSYRPGINAPMVMSSFVGADGNAITSPYILQDAGLSLSGEYDACVVWEDVMPGYGIVSPESVKIVNSPSGAGLSCPYICFYIAPEDIKPGNVVLALRDKGNGNKILWSWHIWLIMTDSVDVQTSNVVFRPTSTTTASLSLMNVNLGWAPPISYEPLTTTQRTNQLRFVQDTPGTASRTMSVTQQAYAGAAYEGKEWNGTFYQWGRKDPFLSGRGYSSGEENYNKCGSSPSGYTITSGVSYVPQSRHSGTIENLYSTFSLNPTVMYRNDDLVDALNAWDADNTQFATDSPVLKTIYDPCPPGFSVPRFRAFTGFTVDGTNATSSSEIYGDYIDMNLSTGYPCGWMFTATANQSNKTIFFPISGMRIYNGNITSTGERGYYWTSARYDKTNPQASYSESGFFSTSRVDPLYNAPAGHAMSIRPVRE